MKILVLTPAVIPSRSFSCLSICLLATLAGCVSNSTPVPPLLTVPSITWAPQATIAYGTLLSSTQLSATSSVPGTFTYAPKANYLMGSGANTLTAMFVPTDGKYATVGASTTITITPIAPTVIYAPSPISTGVGITVAQQDATATTTVTNLGTPGTFPLAGVFTYTEALGAAYPAGTQNLNVSFTATDVVNYTTVKAIGKLSVSTPASAYSYNNLAIVGGGFVTGLVAHPGSDPTHPLRYARTDVGGAYRSTTLVNQWVPITDQFTRDQSGYQGIESIGIDPSDATKLYLAVGMYAESWGSNGAFLISPDQGNTYKIVPVSFKMGSNDNGRHAGERLAVDPNLGTKLYFGSRLNGLQTSTDSGNTWSQVSSFPVKGTTAGVGVVFVDFIKSSGSTGTITPVIYVGVSDTGISTTGYSSLYRSIDAGLTWQAVPGQPTGLYPSHGVLGPDGAMYLSYGDQVGPNGISKGSVVQYTLPSATSPGGVGAFKDITPSGSARPSGTQGGFGAVAVDPSNKGVLMASTLDDWWPGDDIYRSMDSGTTWVSLNQAKKLMDTSLSPWLLFGGGAGTGNWPGTMLIDPFNSSRFMYGTGQTIYESDNINVAAPLAPKFSVGALGLEETVVLALSSPNVGPLLVSGVGDIGGFTHTSLTQSPTGGMSSPIFGNTTSIDFAQGVVPPAPVAGAPPVLAPTAPAIIARVGNSGGYGAFSTDGGSTWKAFPSLPAGTTSGQGQIAVGVDGTSIVWAPGDAPVAYTNDNGKTWHASTGAPAKSGIVADRFNVNKFYILAGGTLQRSVDGGKTFGPVTNGLPGGTLTASFAAEGDLWISTGWGSSGGLTHSIDSGATFTPISGFSANYATSFGKSAGKTYFVTDFPTIYTVGVYGGVYGFYRSIDAGNTWVLINDAAHEFGYVGVIAGDPKTFGRFYIGTGGRGILYGDSAF